jgi:hypothetical protein
MNLLSLSLSLASPCLIPEKRWWSAARADSYTPTHRTQTHNPEERYAKTVHSRACSWGAVQPLLARSTVHRAFRGGVQVSRPNPEVKSGTGPMRVAVRDVVARRPARPVCTPRERGPSVMSWARCEPCVERAHQQVRMVQLARGEA